MQLGACIGSQRSVGAGVGGQLVVLLVSEGARSSNISTPMNEEHKLLKETWQLWLLRVNYQNKISGLHRTRPVDSSRDIPFLRPVSSVWLGPDVTQGDHHAIRCGLLPLELPLGQQRHVPPGTHQARWWMVFSLALQEIGSFFVCLRCIGVYMGVDGV